MDSPLRYVYFEKRCNVCGGTYPVTLLNILKEQRLSEEWTSARPCEACHSHYLELRERVPADLLRNLAQAWDELSAALASQSLEPKVGDPKRE